MSKTLVKEGDERAWTTGAKFLAGIRSDPTLLGVGLLDPDLSCALAGSTTPKMAAPAPTAPEKQTYRRYAIHFEQDGQWTKEVVALFALGMPHTEREGWQTSDVDITTRGARGHAKSHLTRLKVNIPRFSHNAL